MPVTTGAIREIPGHRVGSSKRKRRRRKAHDKLAHSEGITSSRISPVMWKPLRRPHGSHPAERTKRFVSLRTHRLEIQRPFSAKTEVRQDHRHDLSAFVSGSSLCESSSRRFIRARAAFLIGDALRYEFIVRRA